MLKYSSQKQAKPLFHTWGFSPNPNRVAPQKLGAKAEHHSS